MTGLAERPGSSPAGHRLCEGITSLYRSAADQGPVTALTLVQPDANGTIALTHADSLGTSGNSASADELSEAFRVGPGLRHVNEDAIRAHADRLIEARLLMTGFTARRGDHQTRYALVIPIPDPEPRAMLVVALSEPAPAAAGHIALCERIAGEVGPLLNQPESPEEELRRLRRVNAVEVVLPALVDALDIREVFQRVSEVSKHAVDHDFLSVATFNDDYTELRLYAQSSDWQFPETGPVQFPAILVETFVYHVVYDLMEAQPADTLRATQFGARSSLRVPVRHNNRVVAAINFSSKQAGHYTAMDVEVGQRIAAYVALAMSHQQLADESRRASALQERENNLEMLDGLLSTLAGVLDVRDVFQRVSDIAKKVLPHDLMGLPLFSSDGKNLIVHAVVGAERTATPLPITPMHRRLMHETWDHLIIDDILTDVDLRESVLVPTGVRSLLRVAIRVEQRLMGFLDFGKFTTGYYQASHALVARRIADHVALAMSHQRLAEEMERAIALQQSTANLQMLDSLLSALIGVLDIRDVFARVSEITSRVIPHDAMALPIITDDREHVIPFATVGVPSGLLPTISPIPDSVKYLLTEHWDTILIDDILLDPRERENPFATAGLRSMMRVAIRLEGELVSLLIVFSRKVAAFTKADALIGRRIADHVALAISHQRLADESRRTAALQERAANLEALDGLLDTVAGVLDIRSVFARISEIGNTVMPHDAMTIATRTRKPGIALLYAATGALSHLPVPMETPSPYVGPTGESSDYRVVDDLNLVEQHATMPGPKVGLRSILTIPIRIGGEPVAHVNFLSRTPGRFTRDDVPMARRIADHIALTLSHEQLAEEMRKSEELRARTANIGLLDALLASVTDNADLKTVCDRVADITLKVLPYDAMILPVVVNDGAQLKFHLLRTPEGATFPETMEVPPHLRNTEWEHSIVEDLQTDPHESGHPLAKLGLRAAMRIAIRVQGQLTAGVAFYSFTPGIYKEADVAIGRRIAARLAISLMREQGMAASRRADEAAERAARLESRVRTLTEELNARSGFHRVIGSSPTWRQALTQATQVASTDTTVLLLGESGTGKEVIARFIHRASARKNGPFVALNCAALPEQLLESELFGYERGAFTGAMNARAGKIEQAAGGVLFLDEVGEMSPIVQAKFLRVLQEREFQRLGGSKTLKADTRVIAATNRDPKIAMERGAFREDLYYRLSVFEIGLPPLRDRRDDILLLVESFLSDLAKNIGRPAGGLSEDAKDRLLSYHWPGNVRELRNAIERAVILAEGGLITSDHLPIAVGQARPSAPAAVPVPATAEAGSLLPPGLKLETLERDLLHKAMAQAKNNKSQAAKLLGVPRGQFYSLLKRHGLTDAKR